MRRHKAKERGDNSVHWILDSFFILSFFVSHLFFSKFVGYVVRRIDRIFNLSPNNIILPTEVSYSL